MRGQVALILATLVLGAGPVMAQEGKNAAALVAGVLATGTSIPVIPEPRPTSRNSNFFLY